MEKREFFHRYKAGVEVYEIDESTYGEVIVAPVGDSLNGKLVCDMAISGIGKLKTSVEVVAKTAKLKS